MSRNQLDQETSPYLLQHRDNPVHWRPWGAQALAEAQTANKPILLSVGYAACHWCHVMAHESFEDPDTARLMNDLYIPIKVDREERPDIDIIYQAALASLGQQGGWPLTMFLTPEGDPFWGGTYFPLTARFGRPGFKDVLTGVAQAFETEPEKIRGNVTALKAALAAKADPGSLTPSLDMLDKAGDALAKAIDPLHGGLKGAPKFPQVPMFSLIWRASLRGERPALAEAVSRTLDHMCQGGIYDHLGGGFARYSTDERWLVPHFEKMLYDNAQMIELLVLAWQKTRRPLYAQRIAETIDWLSRDMIAEHGAFAATLDADSEGEEGKYYVWTEAEIDGLLPADQASLFKTVYQVTAGGNWEGVTILNRNHPAGETDAATEDRLKAARAVLLAHRQRRVPPGRDDKILADWNGMMIAALAQAAFAFDRPDWLAMAERAFTAVRREMRQGARLVHSLRQGRRQAEAMLDDYAQMARAALILSEITGKDDYQTDALNWLACADRHYWDEDLGGYYFTADDAVGLITRTKTGYDNATPSGNGVMVEVLARLYYHTGDERYRQRAEEVVTAFAGDIERSFPGMATLLNSWEMLDHAVQVVVIGQPDDPTRQAMLRVVAEQSLPNRVLSILTPDHPLPPEHPAAQKQVRAGQHSVLAYACFGPYCVAPVADPETLRQMLTER